MMMLQCACALHSVIKLGHTVHHLLRGPLAIGYTHFSAVSGTPALLDSSWYNCDTLLVMWCLLMLFHYCNRYNPRTALLPAVMKAAEVRAPKFSKWCCKPSSWKGRELPWCLNLGTMAALDLSSLMACNTISITAAAAVATAAAAVIEVGTPLMLATCVCQCGDVFVKMMVS